MDAPVKCRARVSDACFDGRPVGEVYEPPDWEREDGTYDTASMSVICTPCYIELMPYTPSGQGLLEELPGAIISYRARVEGGETGGPTLLQRIRGWVGR